MSLSHASKTAYTVMVLLALSGCFDASMIQQGRGGLPFAGMGLPSMGTPKPQDSRVTQLDQELDQYEDLERHQQAVPVAEEYLRLVEQSATQSGGVELLAQGRLRVAAIHHQAGNATRAEELYLASLQALREGMRRVPLGLALELPATRGLARLYQETKSDHTTLAHWPFVQAMQYQRLQVGKRTNLMWPDLARRGRAKSCCLNQST